MPGRIAIRFSERSRAMLDREAEIEGVSVSAFIREAALARCYFAMGRRGELDLEASLATKETWINEIPTGAHKTPG